MGAPEKRPIIGYTTGVFDLFHVGHVNLLRNARSMCDHLIVGVSIDELVRQYKKKTPVIAFGDRIEVVRACRYVDTAIPQVDMDKLTAWRKLRFDVAFVADDWYDSPSWRQIEKDFNANGVRLIYLPYTKGVSSTLINDILEEKRAAAQANP